MPVAAAATLGDSGNDSARGPVDGSGVARNWDERLYEHGGGAESFDPVFGHAP